jgi:hypothetical protein
MMHSPSCSIRPASRESARVMTDDGPKHVCEADEIVRESEKGAKS